MAAEVTAVFAGDTSQLDRALSKVRSNLQVTATEASKTLTFTPRVDDRALKQALSRAGSGSGGGRKMDFGNASAQIQDIAVQMQMGAKGATVFAQQVPQLMSAFGLGKGGAIIGGIAAIGGALYSVGQNSVAAFDKLIAGAKASHASVEGLISNGGLSDVISKLKEINAQSDTLSKERGNVNGVGVQLGRLMGGASPGERTLAIQDEQIQSADDLARLQARAVELSGQELHLASLRAQGREKEATEIERQIKLKAELARIDQMQIGGTTKEKLKADAQAISLAEKEGRISSARAAEENRKLQEQLRLSQAIKTLRGQLREQKTAGGEGADRIKVLEARLQEMRNDAVLGGLATTEEGAAKQAGAGNLRGAEASLRWLKEYRDVMAEIDEISGKLKDDAIQTAKANAAAAQAKRQEQSAFEAMVDAENARIEEENTKAATATARTMAGRASTLTDMATNAAITNAQAHGHDRKAERLQSALGQQQKTQQLIDAGMNPADAAKAAQGMQRDENKVNGIRNTIGRAVPGSKRGDSPMDLLKNAAAQAQQRAAAAAKDGQVSLKEGADILAELKVIAGSLKIIN